MGFFSAVRRILSYTRLVASGWGSVSGPEYHHFRNLILSTSRGSVEIDRLVVSRFGVFVIEEKKRSGWIFGDAFDSYWTAVHFKRKYRFQNPLHQNFGHVKALEEFLEIDQGKIHPLIVFRGHFEFKTPVPRGVFLYSCASWISNQRNVLLTDSDVDRIVDTLRERTTTAFFATLSHAWSVNAKYRSKATCPKCGGDLVPRVARRGPTPGSRFLGCSNYPHCKYIRG